MKVNLNLLPFELSQRILKQGYNYEVLYAFNKENGNEVYKLEDWKDDVEFPCPMATHVLQWFREEKDIQVFPLRIGNVTMPFIGYSFIAYYPDNHEAQYSGEVYESEEEAIVAGINYVLDNYEFDDNILVNPNESETVER